MPVVLRIALLSDIHYAEKEPKINRFYRESPSKLAAAAMEFAKHAPDFLVELGDLIDSVGSVKADKEHLARIHEELAVLANERHYVLGNHCVETLAKEEFLAAVGREKSYYSFDRSGWHFVVLDGCFRGDGVPYGRKNAKWTDTKLPGEEIEWLRADLEATDRPCILFLHQRLDLANDNAYAVKNADAVRTLLERSGKVRLVLQGHYHKGDYKEIAGIPYCTLTSLVEGTGASNNAFSLLEIDANGAMRLHGFFRQPGHRWKAGKQIN